MTPDRTARRACAPQSLAAHIHGPRTLVVIGKADAVCSITGYSVVLDGLEHTATGSCTGVNDETLEGLDVSHTTHSAAGTFNDPWYFTDGTGNYNNTSGSVDDAILYSTSSCLGSPGHQILQPINSDGSSIFKQGSTVPAKFRVCDAYGKSVGTAGVVTSFKLIRIVAETVPTPVVEDVASTTPDTAFRWSSSDQQWIFNINTKSLIKNKTYTYQVTLADGSNIQFQFGLK